MSKCSMIQVNRVYLKIIFINHPQFFVVSNATIIKANNHLLLFVFKY